MAGILESFRKNVFDDDELVISDPALESEIILTAIRDECKDDEDFAVVMESCAVELGLYDVISDAEIATEAAKRIVIQDFKAANFSRILRRTCIRLAAIDDNNDYKKYKMYRDKMIEVRNNIYKKYEARAKTEARRIIANARNKAANMNSNAGKDITSKMDAQIAKMNGK